MNKKFLFLLYPLLLLLLAVLLVGCGIGSREKGRRPSADWSRGLPVGSDLRGSIAITVEPDGEPVHLAWPEAIEDQVVLHYEQLNQNAETVLERNLDLQSGRIRSPRLLPGEEGGLTLFWAARPAGSDGWQLRVASLNAGGEISDAPQLLSPTEMNVAGYTVAQGPAGRQYVVWEDSRTDALYGLELVAGEPTGSVHNVAAGGGPALAVDESGSMHLIWRSGEALFYADYGQGPLAPASGTQVAQLHIIFGDTLDGPVLAVSDGWVYALWSIFSQSGLESGTGRTEYVAFPVSEPDMVEPERVRIMPPEEQPYEPYAGALPLTQLVPPPPSPAMTTDYVGEPAITTGPGREAAAVVSANQALRQQTVVQLALVIFDDGRQQGYQMAGKTQNISRGATVTTDAAGNLYIAWGEGAGGLDAYFATTAPAMRGAINRLEPGDAANLLLTSTMESVVGLLFMPLAIIWMLPGGLLVALWHMRREEEQAGHAGSRIVFVIAVALYQTLKILFMPAIQTYVPFSAWLDLPPAWQEPLIVLVPLLIFLFALLIAEGVRRRREATSTPRYFFLVAAVDAALTLFVYGVNFLGVF